MSTPRLRYPSPTQFSPFYPTARRFGTTRRDPVTGDQIKGEYDGYGNRMGGTGGNGPGHDWSAFDRAFPSAPMVPVSGGVTPAPAAPNPMLAFGAATGNPLAMASAVTPPVRQSPGVSGGATSDDVWRSAFGGAPRSTAGPFAQNYVTANGGVRTVPYQPSAQQALSGTIPGYDSMTPAQRGAAIMGRYGNMPSTGTVVDSGASAFNARGERNFSGTNGPGIEYDPTHDTGLGIVTPGGNVTFPGIGTATGGPALPPGADRGIVSKYGTASVRFANDALSFPARSVASAHASTFPGPTSPTPIGSAPQPASAFPTAPKPVIRAIPVPDESTVAPPFTTQATPQADTTPVTWTPYKVPNTAALDAMGKPKNQVNFALPKAGKSDVGTPPGMSEDDLFPKPRKLAQNIGY